MFIRLFSYFSFVVFNKARRQKILLLSFVGLALSSFSLLSLQSVMNGLQKGLIERSKSIEGEFFIKISNSEIQNDLIQQLKKEKISFQPELELELLIRNGKYFTPVILRGVKQHKSPLLIEKDQTGVVLGSDLGRKLKIYYGENLELILANYYDDFLGEVPKMGVLDVSDFLLSDVAEIDGSYAWVRLAWLQNLIRDRLVNRLRFFSENDESKVLAILEKYDANQAYLVSWKDQYASLNYALNLEKYVMFFLFSSMIFLIALTISSGFIIFYEKIKSEMVSLWIMGLSKKQIFRKIFLVNQLLNLIFCFVGIGLSTILLYYLKFYGPSFFPEYFVEAKLPVEFSLSNFIVAAALPFSVCTILNVASLKHFFRHQDIFLKSLRETY
ncbi:FtsX-like permease family protein [Bacteriovoracaceae bacterium]|nr:FtsX-like permease family protein [Bacteriovoracaceae bacterium]